MMAKIKTKETKEKAKKTATKAKSRIKKAVSEKAAGAKKAVARKAPAKKEKLPLKEHGIPAVKVAPEPKADIQKPAALKTPAPKKEPEVNVEVEPIPKSAPKTESPPAPKPEPKPVSKVEPKPVAEEEHIKPVEPPKPAAPKPQVVQPPTKPPASEEKSVVAPAPSPKEAKPVPEPSAAETKPKILELDTPIALKELASKINVKPNEIILELMSKNIFATINQSLGEEIVASILKARGIEFRKPAKVTEQVAKEHMELEAKQDARHLVGRPPVVTFMGHVDHGKTSLLDFIRKTRVADKEKGGITQHIGAYEVKLKNGSVTFLDTPGHEAFTAMRARGANATDIVVLVVAADDGVMPQTKEALDHARAAGVTIVVAINKCDLPSANVEKVKGQLAQIGLTPEDWGGKTIAVPVSAKTGEGVDHLLEMLLLEAELLELKANPVLRARGIVIEGKLSSGQGPVATVLVKNGTLRVGDLILTGMHYGRIKAMMDHTGSRVEEAPPSKPVTVLGLSGVPMAGDEFFVVKDEKKARTLSLLKQDEARSRRLKMSQRVTLEDFYSKMKEGATKELVILLKGDVQGSVEALKASLLELSTKDVKVSIIHADVGNISESDVMLAVASNAVVIGFNVKVDDGASALAAKEGIEIKTYGIIYEAIEDVKAAMEGLLEPVSKEVFVGRAIVKQIFRVTKAGTIAGSQVVRGKIVRTGIAKLVRDKNVVYEGKIASLKRFKDDVREVAEGFECGIGLAGHDDIKVGDLIEVYQIEKIARRLEHRK
ncbi:MAG: translation initiation factor IF-2 [Candidatus Omnitrophica bacterium]|nr:translation initiation factor IF-2 [Candidatus Omnitrophota bacterium]